MPHASSLSLSAFFILPSAFDEPALATCNLQPIPFRMDIFVVTSYNPHVPIGTQHPWVRELPLI
jgi:hypothetical protein